MLIDPPEPVLRCGNQLLDLGKPVVMGIINTTADSFYPASRTNFNIPETLHIAQKMVGEGARILDIGGISSRPGSQPVSEQEEMDRVLPAVEAIHAALPETIISVDTYRAAVASLCIGSGAGIINDISGGELDANLWKQVAEHQVAYVLMHMRGTPADMQEHTTYQDLMGEISRYFISKLRSLRDAGIRDVVLDPGFGFAKTMEQNYALVRHLGVFRFLERPLMIGLSRKSTLSKTIGRPVEETLHATTAMHMAALLQGAVILRTHDVQAAADAIEVFHQLNRAKSV
jgi:dihydropteroate synthase